MRNLYLLIENAVRTWLLKPNVTALKKLHLELSGAVQSGEELPSCVIYDGDHAVRNYASVFCELNRSLSEEECMIALGRHAYLFSEPDAETISAEEVQAVFAELNRILPYTANVIGGRSLEIMLFPDKHTERSGETAAVFTEPGLHGYICLYCPHLDVPGMSGAAVLLHELGHLLHMKVTGTLDEIPASFLAFLQAVGVKYQALDQVQILDLFADTFLIAVQTRTAALQDPFPMIDPNFKQVCFDYIAQVVKHLRSDADPQKN